MHKNKLWHDKPLDRTTSLDSLANSSSNHSESLSDESHDSDSGADTKSKNNSPYVEKNQNCLRPWPKTDNTTSDSSYDYLLTTNNDNDIVNRRCSSNDRMETIPEESEPKISVKEILARFENLKDNKKFHKPNKSVQIHTNNNNLNCTSGCISVNNNVNAKNQQENLCVNKNINTIDNINSTGVCDNNSNDDEQNDKVQDSTVGKKEV